MTVCESTVLQGMFNLLEGRGMKGAVMSFLLQKLITLLGVAIGEDLGERPVEFAGKLKPA